MPYVELYLSNVYFSRFEAQSFEVYLSYTSFKLCQFCLIIVNQACDFFGLLLPPHFLSPYPLLKWCPEYTYKRQEAMQLLSQRYALMTTSQDGRR